MSLHDTENIWGDFPSDDGVENSFEEPIDEIEPEQLEEKRRKKRREKLENDLVGEMNLDEDTDEK